MIGYHKRLRTLGGMEPEATASLYLNIIKSCQKSSVQNIILIFRLDVRDISFDNLRKQALKS